MTIRTGLRWGERKLMDPLAIALTEDILRTRELHEELKSLLTLHEQGDVSVEARISEITQIFLTSCR